jgi:hypothetical protein
MAIFVGLSNLMINLLVWLSVVFQLIRELSRNDPCVFKNSAEYQTHGDKDIMIDEVWTMEIKKFKIFILYLAITADTHTCVYTSHNQQAQQHRVQQHNLIKQNEIHIMVEISF